MPMEDKHIFTNVGTSLPREDVEQRTSLLSTDGARAKASFDHKRQTQDSLPTQSDRISQFDGKIATRSETDGFSGHNDRTYTDHSGWLLTAGAVALGLACLSFLGAPLAGVALITSAAIAAVDIIQHQSVGDRSSLLDRPGSLLKASVAGAAVVGAFVMGGASAFLIAAGIYALTEVLVDDGGSVKFNADSVKAGLTSLTKDVWAWIKIVILVLIGLLISRDSLKQKVAAKLGKTVVSATSSNKNLLSRIFKRRH